MTIQVVGAGLGRTGTHSLKLGLERLLGAPCYHMVEAFQHPDHVPVWSVALQGEVVDFDGLLAGYAAIVDWPGAAVWRDIAAANPRALVLLSTRRTTDEWWTSAKHTIFELTEPPPGMEAWFEMAMIMLKRFTPAWPDEAACRLAYERHNADVRAEVPPDRLIDWQAPVGWGPLYAALEVAVPDEPFPVTNTTNEFRARSGKDPIPRA